MPRGGARPNTGPTVNRLRLDAETARMLRIMTLARRAVTGNANISPVDVATDLIRAAFAEYETRIEHAVDNDQT